MPYPRDALDQPDVLLDLLGTYWSQAFAGSDQLLAYCDGVGRAEGAARDALGDALACLSIDAVPVYRTGPWRPLTFLRSAARASAAAAFGAAGTFGAGAAYGAADGPPAYAVDSGVASVAWIFDRIATPTVSLCAGLDFVATPGRVAFRTDPFADPRLVARPVVDASGAVVDAEMTLWLYRPGVDHRDVHDHFGYALGLDLPSSEASKALVVALWDAAVKGSSGATLGAVLAALTGVPAAAGAEVVEAVGRDRRGLLVVTDRAAYRLPAAATPLVAPGDALAAGDPLCDAVTLHPFNRGEVPPGLRALAIGPGVLAPGYAGDLTFEGGDVPLVVAADGAGRARASFAVAGFPADVRAFWDEVHARGVAAGRTLAQLLDARAAPAGEPTAADLPPTVDPLGFLCANFLRANCVLARIRAGSLPGGGDGGAGLRLLRRVVPPHVALLVLVDMPTLADAIGSAPSPAEALAGYTAADPLVEAALPHGSRDALGPLRPVLRSCL